MVVAKRNYFLKFLSNKAKALLLGAVQFLLRPIWNFLPQVQYKFSLNIVNTKVCNANCVFCAYQFLPADKRTFMSDEIFNAIVEGIKKLTLPLESIHFTTNSGDPLLDKRFLEMVRSLRKAGVKKIILTTNGIAVDVFGAQALLDELDKINISTTVFSEDMYRRIYRSEQFERMRMNTFSLLELNSKRKSRRLIYIIMHSDIPEAQVRQMPETKKLMGLADRIDICIAHGDWLGLIKKDMLPGCMYIEKPRPLSRRVCQFLLTVPAVYPDGSISACVCRNIYDDPGMALGNIKDTSLDDAMRKLADISAKWSRGDIPSTCYRCTMYGDPSYYWFEYFKVFFFRKHEKNNR